MTIHIDTEKDKYGMWCFTVSAGDSGDLDEYACSEYEYDTSDEAERAALIWIIDAWHVM